MRLIVLTALSLWLAAIIAAPLIAQASGTAALPIYAAFSWICHRQPQRTWHLGAFPLAVCVRCFGIYVGALLAAIMGQRFSRRLWIGSMILLASEWLVEAAGWAAVPDFTRFAAGLPAGFFSIPALWGNTERVPSVIHG